jgi:hypothetical protein
MNAFQHAEVRKGEREAVCAGSGNQLISAHVFSSPAGQFLNANVLDGGGRVIRWQLRLRS